MNRKSLIIGLTAVFLLVGVSLFQAFVTPYFAKGASGGGSGFYFTPLNSATTTTFNNGTSTLANPSNWTPLVYGGNSADGFVSICDNADGGISASNPIYLGFGATSTKPFGYRLASGACYKMTLSDENMFYGTIYALASTSSSTILQIFR